VVCSLGTADLERTVDSLRSSAAAAQRSIEIVVVWQREGQAPVSGDDVRVLPVFPLGVSHARNRGLAVAASPLVGFVDDDEVADPGWVAAALRVFAAGPRPVAAFGPVAPLDDRGLPYCHLEPGRPRVFTDASTPPWIVGTAGNMVFDRDELLAAGGFDPLLGAGAEGRAGEETDLVVRLLGRGRRLVWEPGLGVYHPTKDEREHLAIRFPYAHGMGRALRKNRRLAHTARYLLTIRESLGVARRERDSRRRREAAAPFRGFLAGGLRPVDRRSPLHALDYAPVELRQRIAGGGWHPLALRTEPSLSLHYRRGTELLEVWIDPGEADFASAGPGVAVAAGLDSLWLLRTAAAGPRRIFSPGGG